VAVLIAIHNSLLLGDSDWAASRVFVVAAGLYGLSTWAMLKARRFRKDVEFLGTFFFATDILLLILAIHVTGGPSSWLFLLLGARSMDQIVFGYRRAVVFNHLVVAAYILYLALLEFKGGHVVWRVEAVKLAALYGFNWYCCFTALTRDLLRRRVRSVERACRTAFDRVPVFRSRPLSVTTAIES
jgi:hypothetical protein